MKHILLIFLCVAVLRTTNAMVFEFEKPNIVTSNDVIALVENLTGIQQIRSDLSVYPNPASTDFFVRFEIGEKTIVSVSLFDALGREVKVLERNIKVNDRQEIHYNIDASLPNGRYFLRVEADGKLNVKSLIIKH